MELPTLYFVPLTPVPDAIVNKNRVDLQLLRLRCEETREDALFELTKFKGVVPDLADMIWNSFQTMMIFAVEIRNLYNYLINPPTMTVQQSSKVLSILVLLEIVASYADTRSGFLDSKILELLNPYMTVIVNTVPIENLKYKTLKLIAAVVKDEEILKVVMEWDLIGQCFDVLSDKSCSYRCKFLAISIMREILSNDISLDYYCRLPNSFATVSRPLAALVVQLEKMIFPNFCLLKKVLECYHEISRNENGIQALRQQIPTQMISSKSLLSRILKTDISTKEMRRQLREKIRAELPFFECEPPAMYDVLENSRVLPLIANCNLREAENIPTSSRYSNTPPFPFDPTPSTISNIPTFLDVITASGTFSIHETSSDVPSTSGNHGIPQYSNDHQ